MYHLLCYTRDMAKVKKWTAEEIKEKRIERRETQAAFAHVLGVTQVTVARLETGVTRPSFNTMRALDELENE